LLESAIASAPELAAAQTLVGLAGTVACLAAVDQELDGYIRERVHHYRLAVDRVEAILERLAATDSAGRRAVPGVEADRADVIVGGTIVLLAVMRRFGFAECLTSEADILDGLVLSTSEGHGLPTV
jgi:exopolyphosphatase/guanosine-5'-triphosphate,3'-diphosphate pyrophosphatase